jgi:predicted ATP-dependent Lon-type protease
MTYEEFWHISAEDEQIIRDGIVTIRDIFKENYNNE